MAVAIRRWLVMTLLYLHLLGEVVTFFGQQAVVVTAKVASLLPQFIHLGVLSLGDSPDPLSLALVSFSVLLDPLLYLTLVQTMGPGSPPRL